MLFETKETYENELEALSPLFETGGFPHRMPKGCAMTKVLQKSMDMVRQIAAGTYMSDWNWDTEWLEANGLTKLKMASFAKGSFADTCTALREGVAKLSVARKGIGVFPRDKSTLPDDFPTFLFNERTGKSWWLYLMVHGNETLHEGECSTWVEQLPKSFKSVLPTLGVRRWEAELPSYAEGVVRLAKWHRENRECTEAWVCVYSPVDFWNSYLGHVLDITGTDEVPSKGHFEVGGRTFASWKRRIGI